MKRPSNKHLLSLAVAALAQATVAANSYGQQERRGNAALLIEEVLITAQKKSNAEAAQGVPIAVSALSGDQIEASFAEDLNDIGSTMPNVRFQNVGTFPGVANFTIRGMGPLASIASDEPTVGTTVDGMYLGVNFGGQFDTFDMESVEVLRGPQGTLFGRNVTGGAISLRSRRPSGEFAAKVKSSVGSGGRREVAGYIENALSEELAGKVFVSKKVRDGDFKQSQLGGKFGAEDNLFIRPSLLWNPSDNLEVALIAEYGKNKGDGAVGKNRSNPYGFVPDADDFTLSHNFDSRLDSDWKQLIAEANWDLGEGTLTSITAYRDVSFFASSDGDGTPISIFNIIGTWVEQDQFSQELRYAATIADGALDYTVGAYYFEQDIFQREARDLFANPFSRNQGAIDNSTIALFTNVDWLLNDELTLSLGGRYTREKKAATVSPGDQCNADFSQCIVTFEDSKTWNNFSPKVGLSWTPSEDLMLYSSWTRGFRSGGYNIRTSSSLTSPGPYDEEMVEAFEVGIKSDWLDGRARVNAALFHNTYDDLQRSILDSQTFQQTVLNAAAATINGVELELTLLPVDSFAVTASVGYLDASFDEFRGLDLTGDNVPDPELAKNLELIRAPELTYSLTATYDIDLSDTGFITLRAAYSYTDEIPVNDKNEFFHDDYGLIDASASLTTLDEQLKISLWGKNLSNQAYAHTGTHVSIFQLEYLSLPRTYGLDISYQF